MSTDYEGDSGDGSVQRTEIVLTGDPPTEQEAV